MRTFVARDRTYSAASASPKILASAAGFTFPDVWKAPPKMTSSFHLVCRLESFFRARATFVQAANAKTVISPG
jgi:hypothetical protein